MLLLGVHQLPESKVVLVNSGTSALQITEHTSFVSFGKIKFMKIGAEDNDKTARNLNPQTDIVFNPQDYHELVLMNNKITSLGALVQAKLQENPTQAKLCYHEIISTPTSAIPGFFEIKQTHAVFARVQAIQLEADAASIKGNMSTIGSTIPVHQWISDRMKIRWQVKWMKKGLMPVCPKVILTFNAEIDVGMAVMLSA